MKKNILLITVSIFVMACGVKNTRNMVTSGDYDGAVSRAVEGLQGNKDAKGKQDYVYLLEEAFAKAKERDAQDIATWFKGNKSSDLEKIYTTYQQLNARQESIKPLLPLKLIKEGRNAIFPFEDYTDEIISSKNALSKYLYTNSVAVLMSANTDKIGYRRVYDDLLYLNQVNPNYKDVSKLIGDAQFKGTDFVNVLAKNETNVIIPTRLEDDLLDFNAYGLNDKWTVYHSKRQQGIVYDYGVIINFRDITISPEQIKEREFSQEKIIKDGKKKLLDARGREVKDSLGRPIYVDNMKTIKIAIYETLQQKAAQVTAKVDYVGLKSNQLIETFPLSSTFTFQNVFARYKGDRRACDAQYLANFDRRPVPFPSSEQMVSDCGKDLKAKLKDIISKNAIRK